MAAPDLSAETAPAEQITRLRWVIGQLRAHCPWTRQLTHGALVEYLVEEAYEVLEEIEAGETGDLLRKEMGDLLFQVALHAQLAEERGDFDLDGVAEAINAKLIRRNPHVFTAEGALDVDTTATVAQIEQTWNRVKAREQVEAGAVDGAERPSAQRHVLAETIDSLPAHLPALARAAKLVDRLGRQNAGLLPAADPARSVPGTGEGRRVAAAADEDALGELLFSVVQVARAEGQDPERALRNHVKRLAHP